ncbi:ester hydrolase C11orf54 homolog isoform X2 [Monomorium pharaonis]|uniref:ester hydrolase C11orf54 homolog isoform X2 n=1 Tax=Monomorium pharaonis TaxID=307658 RepID=UPI0017468085|nr:ester hydrolase C11orf54 homolog isoform X2 [Monomorium pharaonis]
MEISTNGTACTKENPYIPIGNMFGLHVPTLPAVRDVLQEGMSLFFRELKIDIAACPCLTKPPYNLAGMGLCGNPSLIQIGGLPKFMTNPHQNINTAQWNIREVLSDTCNDSFIIGAGYAAKPYMPFNGHLIMNAMYRAPANITNASHIVFADTSRGYFRTEKINNPSQMICSFMGDFFVSEGRQGNVLRVRAKNAIDKRYNIISIMQAILCKHYFVERNCRVALGGILKMRQGRVAHSIMPEKYPERIVSVDNFDTWFQRYDVALKSDLVAVGTLVNIPNPRYRMEYKGLLFRFWYWRTIYG